MQRGLYVGRRKRKRCCVQGLRKLGINCSGGVGNKSLSAINVNYGYRRNKKYCSNIGGLSTDFQSLEEKGKEVADRERRERGRAVITRRVMEGSYAPVLKQLLQKNKENNS